MKISKIQCRMGYLLIVVIICTINLFQVYSSDVEVYKFESFPKEKIALHMPCQESNMFATKCMCHIICTTPDCKNAMNLCDKYASSKGCKYMLLRNVGKKRVATLKRIPTSEELARFDITPFKVAKGGNGKKYPVVKTKGPRPTLQDLATSIGDRSNRILQQLDDPSAPARCGSKNKGQSVNSSLADSHSFLSEGISLFALNYHAPMTLLNSMKTWNSSGLLSLTRENVAILNDPLPEEIAMSNAFGFDILQPKDIPNALTSKPNVLTISAAFYYALMRSKSEYILFLENDFKIDVELSLDDIKAELIAAAGLLDRGIEVVRLQSRKYKGCGTHKDCDHNGIHLNSPDMMERQRNWFAFYCKGQAGTENLVSDCVKEPDYRCFTSWDSNWTLNAVLIRKSTIMNKKYPTQEGTQSIAQLAMNCYMRQDCLETTMSFGVRWMQWRVPVCISYNGLFLHEEIETSY